MLAVLMAKKNSLSHVGAGGRPQMVDVGAKRVTKRTAHAVAVVVLPPALAAMVTEGEILIPKGPVLQVATLAGIMGAKKTAELIPLCHPIPLDDCKVTAKVGMPRRDGSVEVELHCHASAEAKTGVEMEALTGAAVAALAFYDMGKAVTHGIVIREIRLLKKTGGKKDYEAP
ncbi:MAG TPA: cyclic pyranopterin monophosphate synthase MoaC [Opitutaceae bacterium]|jgi:cyclic pyranopterin phosphate synthase|nr:cyclic pyranopterin monophosphate synthase MoaC [Opitutaceae bacterium]